MKHEVGTIKNLRRVFLLGCFLSCLFSVSAQQYTSMSGLIHVPSADMDEAGEARIGVHFLNKEFTPDEAFNCLGKGKYHTTDHYLSITPFSWIELGYTCTLMKGLKNSNKDDIGFYHKDRYFSVKVRPLKEGKWWPSIAIGSNDPWTTFDKKDEEGRTEKYRNQIFCNYYIAATKHLALRNHVIGVHVAYRKWKRDYNNKWNGIVGGITYNPSFARNLRAIAEYTGNEINIGADYLLWKHFLLQASLQDGKYFSGGVCFQINLL